MSRESILSILGLLVLIAPWSGVPVSWLEWILPLLGLAIIFIAFTLRARKNASAAVTASVASDSILSQPEAAPAISHTVRF